MIIIFAQKKLDCGHNWSEIKFINFYNSIQFLCDFYCASRRSWLFHSIELKLDLKKKISFLSFAFFFFILVHSHQLCFHSNFYWKPISLSLEKHWHSIPNQWNRRKKLNFINQNYWFFNWYSTIEWSLFLDLFLSPSSFSIYLYCFSFILLRCFPFNCSNSISHLLDGKLFILL